MRLGVQKISRSGTVRAATCSTSRCSARRARSSTSRTPRWSQPGAVEGSAQTTQPTPVYEYWWTIGHPGHRPENSGLLKHIKGPDELWGRLPVERPAGQRLRVVGGQGCIREHGPRRRCAGSDVDAASVDVSRAWRPAHWESCGQLHSRPSADSRRGISGGGGVPVGGPGGLVPE